ncbi:MAG: ATP-dependent Clp protease ATP-binding subunit [Chloroflexaceae bacterium]|nr:ATP-dependent Clp protease ATP-binding subunit [Chloroflexaceae bacterium]
MIPTMPEPCEFDQHRFLGQINLQAGTPPGQYILFNRVTDRYFFNKRNETFLSLRDTLVAFLRLLHYEIIAIYNLSEGLLFPDDAAGGAMRRLYLEVTTGAPRRQEDLDDDMDTAPVGQNSPPASAHPRDEAPPSPQPTGSDDSIVPDLYGLGRLLRQSPSAGRTVRAAVIVERVQNLVLLPNALRIHDQLQSWSQVQSGNVSFLVADVAHLGELPQSIVGVHRSGVSIINAGPPTQAEIEALFKRAWLGKLYLDFGERESPYNTKSIGIEPLHRRELKSRLEGRDILTIRSHFNECARRGIDKLNLTVLTQITTNTLDLWFSRLADDEIERVRRTLEERVKGQPFVIRRLIARLRTVARDVREQGGVPRAGGRLLTYFFFAGPTGVGKTEVFRALSDVFSTIRTRQFNMPEYNSQFSATRFFGAPPGYVGHGRGELGQFLLDNPATIVLFDEFEKAHPEVRKNFLTILEGNLTTGDGVRVDLSQAIFIFTSNAGATELQHMQPPTGSAEDEYRYVGESKEIVRQALMDNETPPN